MSNLQMILALGALLILSLIIFNVNDNALSTEEVFSDSGYGILATSLASSVIEEANRKHFDSTTDTMSVTTTGPLTDPNSLGCETGEDANDPNTFNDFDDFDGYARVDSSMPSAIFNVQCAVNYVEAANPDNNVNTRTWHKKITVTVTSGYMKDTIRQSSLFSYWTFR